MTTESMGSHRAGAFVTSLLATRLPVFILYIFLLFSAGCRLADVQEDIGPLVAPEPSYSMDVSAGATVYDLQWWGMFHDEVLTAYIRRALSGNFSLQEGYARLNQARFNSRQVDSRLYPGVDGGLRLDSSWSEDGDSYETNTVGIEFAWEIDLWGKLSSAAQAAAFDKLAAEEEVQGIALRLSIEVADTYYQLIEHSLLLQLLKRQLQANETSLHLIKLRFANGAASLVDVYQQEELVAGVKAQFPLTEARLVVLNNRLHVLLGQPPNSSSLSVGDALPPVPAPPEVGIPADLLMNRPDLRQLQRQLVAADYRVAEAVADRLPGIRVGSSAGFVNGDFLVSVFADALATIIDWGYKKNEVEKRRAVVEEKLAAYSQRYLLAIEEVENSLWQERQHERLLTALREQLLAAKAALRESRNRYLRGVTDYLPVLSALVSMQNLERSILQRQREHLSYRLLLYRALGGSILTPENQQAGIQK